MPGGGRESERRVRERAYSLWERAGRPAGRADEVWEEASRADAAPRPGASRFRRKSMAKGQKRGDREQKKPKQDKPKAVVARPALAASHERPAPPTHAKEK
jgi:Protein of unknown function (DUF2934)